MRAVDPVVHQLLHVDLLAADLPVGNDRFLKVGEGHLAVLIVLVKGTQRLDKLVGAQHRLDYPEDRQALSFENRPVEIRFGLLVHLGQRILLHLDDQRIPCRTAINCRLRHTAARPPSAHTTTRAHHTADHARHAAAHPATETARKHRHPQIRTDILLHIERQTARDKIRILSTKTAVKGPQLHQRAAKQTATPPFGAQEILKDRPDQHVFFDLRLVLVATAALQTRVKIALKTMPHQHILFNHQHPRLHQPATFLPTLVVPLHQERHFDYRQAGIGVFEPSLLLHRTENLVNGLGDLLWRVLEKTNWTQMGSMHIERVIDVADLGLIHLVLACVQRK